MTPLTEPIMEIALGVPEVQMSESLQLINGEEISSSMSRVERKLVTRYLRF